MSKFVNIEVSALLSTDFFIEVSDDATEEQIKEIARKEVTLPHKYPSIVSSIIEQKFGIKISGLDSMLKDWNINNVEYVIKSQ